MSKILLSKIVPADGVQVRVKIDEDTVAAYSEAMQDGANFPPVVIFHDGTSYHLADGFHRVLAASRNQFLDIDADIRKGTRQDAAWFALGANRSNGIRLNRADIRNAVALALRAFPERSNREIAKQIGCSHATVGDERAALESTGQIDQLSTTTGADGKERPAKRIVQAPNSATFNPLPEDIDEMGNAIALMPAEPAAEKQANEDDLVSRYKLTAKSIAEKAVFLISGIKLKDPERTDALNRVISYCRKEGGFPESPDLKTAWKFAGKAEREAFMVWADGRGSDLPKSGHRDLFAVLQKLKRMMKGNPVLLNEAKKRFGFIVEEMGERAK